MSPKTNRGGVLPLSISQNFLTSPRTVDGLLALTNIGRGDDVWEIGPGKGHITKRLLGRCGSLTAVELDARLYAALRDTFCGVKDLRLLQGDFLSTPLPRNSPYKVFANLPFSRTTDIVRRLATARNPPRDAWLILAWGAAKRFSGTPRESLQSLLLKPYFSVRMVQAVRREEFHPMPGVDAALLHLHRREKPLLPPEARGELERFLRAMMPALPHGRKAIMSRRQMRLALHRAGLPELPQSATLDYVQWLCLFRCWAGFGMHVSE